MLGAQVMSVGFVVHDHKTYSNSAQPDPRVRARAAQGNAWSLRRRVEQARRWRLEEVRGGIGEVLRELVRYPIAW